MSLGNKKAVCPVCPDKELGTLSKTYQTKLICKECQFVYTWDEKGILLKPIKLDTTCKSSGCNCGRCGR